MLLFITSLITYIFIEYIIRYLCYRDLYLGKQLKRPTKYKIECYKDIVFFISPGYWFARYFKELIIKTYVNKNEYGGILKEFIIKNNHYNIVLSSSILFIIIASFSYGGASYLYGVVLYRFISRSVEISVAFSHDVISKKEKNSYLNEYDRIKLALKSYIEIYIYSASLYMFIPEINVFDAIFISLGTGTFTTISNYVKLSNDMNVKYNEIYIYLINAALFTQVFTTLCLVILSLTIYISNKEPNK